MKERDLKHFRELIEARQQEVEAHSDASSNSRATVELDQQSVGRLSRMDAIERKAMADATNNMRQLELKQLKAALARIEAGEYGYCVDCGEAIEATRLLHSLAVLKCLDCAKG